MKYQPATLGRAFVIRLEDGDIIHEKIEEFAQKNNIQAASVTALGGVDKGSRLVVGPKEGRAPQIESMEYTLRETHEATGTGTIFPNAEGKPVLHMHLACGRGDQTVTGCVRTGVKVWHILEVIIIELTNTSVQRLLDPKTGFVLLDP